MEQKLSDRLAYGCIYRERRWSGDTHEDEGGQIDERATDALMAEAVAIVKAWEDAPEALAEFYSRPPMRALSGIAIDNLELLPLAGKRVKIVEVW